MLTILLSLIILAMAVSWVRQQIRLRALLVYMHRQYMMLPTRPELMDCGEHVVKMMLRRFIRNNF